jgi:hypothetical protein
MSHLTPFNPKRALGCVAKLILALGTTMHYLSAQSKIGDFLAASYLRDLSLVFWRIGATMRHSNRLSSLGLLQPWAISVVHRDAR